jgi:hypothetical protein
LRDAYQLLNFGQEIPEIEGNLQRASSPWVIHSGAFWL